MNQTLYLNIVAVAAFVIIALGLFSLTRLRWGKETKPYDELWNEDVQDLLPDRPQPSAFWKSIRGPFSQVLPPLFNERENLPKELKQAGIYHHHAKTDFLARRNISLCVGLILTGVIVVMIGPEFQGLSTQVLIFGVILTLLFFSIPRLRVQRQAAVRQTRVRDGLADVLDMVALCVTAGVTLPTALRRLAGPIAPAHPELAQELAIVSKQADISSIDVAMEEWEKRSDLAEVKSLRSLVHQSTHLGSDLSESLRAYVDGIRNGNRMRANAKASRVAVRIMLPMILCFLPATLILLWSPALLEARTFLNDATQPGGALERPDLSEFQRPQSGSDQ